MVDIEKLALLARIKLTSLEKEKLQKEFEKIMKGNVFAKIGEVISDKKLTVIGLNEKFVVKEDVNELKKVWKNTFDW